MPLSPAQIKEKLTNALDDNKNVVDETAVEEVLSLLETCPLTKEILERTRLGRDINLVRKTSKNPGTQKRARNLVKAWQKLLVGPGSPQVPNGQHPNVAALARVSPGIQKLSPAATRLSPGLSPAANRVNPIIKNGHSPALSQVKQQSHKGLQSPLVQGNSAKLRGLSKTAEKPKSFGSNDDSNTSWPCTPPLQNGEIPPDRLKLDTKPDSNGSNSGPLNTERRSDRKHSDNLLDPKSTKSLNKTQNSEVSKTNVANRKRTRSSTKLDDSDVQLPNSKQQRCSSPSPSLSTSSFSKSDVINGSLLPKKCKKSQDLPTQTDHFNDSKTMAPAFSRSMSKDKNCKVKTTEQLIEEMQSKTTTPLPNAQAIAQIKTDLIKKENESKNPPKKGNKRGRKKKNAQEPLELPDNEIASDGRKLAQNKNLHIEHFLQTSIVPTPGEDAYVAQASSSRQESLDEQSISLGGCSTNFAQSSYDSNFPSYPVRQDKLDSGPSASPPETRDLEHPGNNLPSISSHDETPQDQSSERLSEQQILSTLPPIDFDNIDWTSYDYPSPQPVQVGSNLIHRLHHENMDSVNGTYDRDGQFRRWAEMLTLDSVYDDPLYILPYVTLNE